MYKDKFNEYNIINTTFYILFEYLLFIRYTHK